jgi:hypothetical protein
MPRDDNSIFTFGMPSYKEAKDAYFGTAPALKIVEDVPKQKEKPETKPEPKKPKQKKDQVVKNYILQMLTKG